MAERKIEIKKGNMYRFNLKLENCIYYPSSDSKKNLYINSKLEPPIYILYFL